MTERRFEFVEVDQGEGERANPLLDGWREAYGVGAVFESSRRDLDLDSPSISRRADHYISTHQRRWELSALYSFAVPSDEALDLIASFGPVVEIGAGTGYWARLLRARGCDVAAYDVMGEQWREWFPGGLLSEVEMGGVESVEQHADRTLLLVWPSYGASFAYDALRAYERGGGQRLVYVGEGHGGCCADDDFFLALGEECYAYDEDHDHADDPEATWSEVRVLSIPQWDGIYDYLTVYERRTA